MYTIVTHGLHQLHSDDHQSEDPGWLELARRLVPLLEAFFAVQSTKHPHAPSGRFMGTPVKALRSRTAFPVPAAAAAAAAAAITHHASKLSDYDPTTVRMSNDE